MVALTSQPKVSLSVGVVNDLQHVGVLDGWGDTVETGHPLEEPGKANVLATDCLSSG